MNRLESPAALTALMNEINGRPQAPRVISCAGGTCGISRGAESVARAIRQQIEAQGAGDRVAMRETACQGFCQAEPVVVVLPERTFYARVTPGDAADIVRSAANGGAPVERLLFREGDQTFTQEETVPFFRKQHRLLMGQHCHLDPTRIEDYIARGGYQAAARCLTEMTPETIIEQIKKADLRGRGGGGFQTARKWDSARKAHGSPKYVLCNADEGNPGAYMDRTLLEGNPHSIIEGMLIGAIAIGASQGYVYCRIEYPLAVDHLTHAIDQARECGLLGDRILGTDFSFDLKVVRGGGAYVCGESTALMASIEGKPGEARAKYIHTAESGLWNKPSNLNNVETWANVPLILNLGAEKYAALGAPGGRGTKIFSLVGAVRYPGLVEVEMGATFREIIFDIGGGIRGGRALKAIQIGGPSGGVLPASALDMKVDFDTLWEAGSLMGAGGVIVADDTMCMVDLARCIIDFQIDESCGKCAPCREGLCHLGGILRRITEGEGMEGDLELIEEISPTMKIASLCGLGQAAPDLLLSTIKYFREEYEEHIRDKKCRAGVCRTMSAGRCGMTKTGACEMTSTERVG